MDEAEIRVHGRVQGVNFRRAVKSFADSNNLKGYVNNRDDGSVLVVAQGNKKDVESLLVWIKGSPGFSKIEKFDVIWRKPRAKYDNFEIIVKRSFLFDQAKSFLNLGKALIIENQVKVPRHVAIIPDGNRRWAREKGLEASFGHYTAGSKEHIISLMEELRKMGVEYFSIWGFSTENWNRSGREIGAIFDLISKNIEKFREMAHKHRIRFRHLGRRDRLPRKLMNQLEELESETKEYGDFNVQICLDYGGRDEIVRAVNKIIKSGVKKVDESTFTEYLDSKGIPDPDLIIRTSGEKRISGLMPYQGAYSELYFTDVYFPDFDVRELRKAIREFGGRVRRFGATAKSDISKT